MPQYCIPEDYNREEVPHSNSSDNALLLTVEFDHLNIVKANDAEFSITLASEINIRWIEPRLCATNDTNEQAFTEIDVKYLEDIWFTNLYIYNLKDIRTFKILQQGKDSVG